MGLLIFLLVACLGVLAKETYPKKEKSEVTEPCNTIQFQRGDILSTPNLWNIQNAKVQPRHWFYAVSNRELWHVAADRNLMKQRGFPGYVTAAHFSKERLCTIRRRVEGRPDTDGSGLLLARRMRSIPLYFDFPGCNCHHYVDYIAYGKTYGSWSTWHYLPASSYCPVHNEFTDDTDVLSNDFKLARKSKNGTLEYLEWPTGWTQEKMRAELANSHCCPQPVRDATGALKRMGSRAWSFTNLARLTSKKDWLPDRPQDSLNERQDSRLARVGSFDEHHDTSNQRTASFKEGQPSLRRTDSDKKREVAHSEGLQSWVKKGYSFKEGKGWVKGGKRLLSKSLSRAKDGLGSFKEGLGAIKGKGGREAPKEGQQPDC